jgi:hypothetical protein
MTDAERETEGTLLKEGNNEHTNPSTACGEEDGKRGKEGGNDMGHRTVFVARKNKTKWEWRRKRRMLHFLNQKHAKD